jgi:hypothetical protein
VTAKTDFHEDHYSLEPRDPRYMSEADLFAFAKKRDFQRTYGRFALQEGEEVKGEFDVFSHFDELSERQIVSGEPVQRAKDRMASAMMRGGTRKMIKATSTRIKVTKSAAKLMGIYKAVDLIIAEPGMDLNPSQISALKELGKAAKLKASRMEHASVHMAKLRGLMEGGEAAKMKAKGYAYKITLPKGEPLYAKTMDHALKVAKEHKVDSAKAIAKI